MHRAALARALSYASMAKQARNADMEPRQPRSPEGVARMHAADKERLTRSSALSTLPAVFLGMMLSWTPSLLFLAHLLWRAPLMESD
jgi:hypothetical protein